MIRSSIWRREKGSFSRSSYVLTAQYESTEQKTAKVKRPVKIVTLGITRHYATNRKHKPEMTANSVQNTTVIQPVAVVKIGGFKFRALLDSGASHSYASSTAIELIKVCLSLRGYDKLPC